MLVHPLSYFITIITVENISGVVRRTSSDRKHSASRERLLRLLETDGVATTAQLVEATGLHENTVRGHLLRLREDGYVRVVEAAERQDRGRQGRGRPAQRWAAIDASAHAPYAGLVTALSHALEDSVPVAHAAQAARAAAVERGLQLAVRNAAVGLTTHPVVELLIEQGFAPEPVRAERREQELVLTKCPMFAAASESPEIVCAAHEGMLEGVARGCDDRARVQLVSKLRPPQHTQISGCVLRLTRGRE